MGASFYIGILAGILSFCGYIPYVRRIINGEVKPERLTWLVWTLSNALVLISYYALGARTTIWVTVSYTVGTAFITVLSIVYGQKGWGFIPKAPLIVAILCSIRWIFFNNFFFVILVNMFLGCVSYIPHIKRLITPGSVEKMDDDVTGWIFYFAGATLNLLVLDSSDPRISFLPFVYFVMNGLILGCIGYYRVRIKNKNIPSV